jgi:hypothetical protein
MKWFEFFRCRWAIARCGRMVLYSFLHVVVTDLTSSTVSKSSPLSSSYRAVPFNDLIEPFSHGPPGSMKSVFTRSRSSHPRTLCATNSVEPGSSPGRLLHNRSVHDQVCNHLLPATVFMLRLLQTLRPVHSQSSVLLPPPVITPLGDSHFPARFPDALAFQPAELPLHGTC